MDWVLAPCDTRAARKLAEEVGVSEIAARVLHPPRLRRRCFGGDVPGRRAARPRPASARRCERCVPTHPQGDSRRDAHLRPRRLRRGRHLRDRARRHCLRELGADVGWHLPSRFEEGYGLSGQTLEKLAEDGLRARAHRRLRHHRRRGGGGRQAAWAGGHRHGPPPARRRVAGLPHRRHEALVVPVSGALRDGRRVQAPPGARGRSARATPRPRRAGHHRRRRPARRREPCVCDCRAEAARPHATARSASAHASARVDPAVGR